MVHTAITEKTDSLSTAFRGGAIAHFVGMNRTDNPLLGDNFTLEEAQHWYDGFNTNTDHINLYTRREEVTNIINQVADNATRVMLFTNLALNHVRQYTFAQKFYLEQALANADKMSDQEFLKLKIRQNGQ